MNRVLLIWLATMTVASSLHGQDFVNLNFEDAKIVFGPGGLATSNALPGWSAFSGTNQLSTIPYNDFLIGPGPVELYGSNVYVLDGNFSVALDNGAISQTGLVPSDTTSLRFAAVTPWGGSPLLVSLGGQNLSYQAIGSAANSYGNPYTIYGANISPLFAGQMETLTFSGGGLLDDIQFSPEAIPEPSTAALFFLGCGILIYVRKRFQSKHRSFARARHG